MLNRPVAQIALNSARIDAVIRQLKSGRVAKHVRMSLDAEISRNTGTLDHGREAVGRQGRAAKSSKLPEIFKSAGSP